MKIVIIGAGAVGCYYGGMLARAGFEVVLLGRARHVEAICRDGLRLETQHFDERIFLPASTQPNIAKGADKILFCVKSTDTLTAATELKQYISSETWLLSLQNGLENVSCLRKALSPQVAAAAVYVAAEMIGPGHVKHHGGGELIIESSQHSEDMVRMLRIAGVPSKITNDIQSVLWTKLIVNCVYNALSAITQLPYGQLVREFGIDRVMQDIVAECLAVAKAAGIVISADIYKIAKDIAVTAPTQYSSTTQDLLASRSTEIDHLNGALVRYGENLGVAVPVNRLLYTLIKIFEKNKI